MSSRTIEEPKSNAVVITTTGNLHFFLEDIREHKNLEELTLKNIKITEIPPKILELKSLRVLKVNEASLSNNEGALDCLNKLTNLEHLELSYCKIHSLPSSLDKLVKLKNLDLHGNNLSSIPKLAKSSKLLQTLNLSSNEIESLPEEMSEFVNLTSFAIRENLILNSIDRVKWNHMVSLISLDFGNNKLSSVPNTLFMLPELKSLNLGGNRIEWLPSNVLEAKKLEYLYIGDNSLAAFPDDILTSARLNVFGSADIEKIRENDVKIFISDITRMRNKQENTDIEIHAQYLQEFNNKGKTVSKEGDNEIMHKKYRLHSTVLFARIPLLFLNQVPYIRCSKLGGNMYEFRLQIAPPMSIENLDLLFDYAYTGICSLTPEDDHALTNTVEYLLRLPVEILPKPPPFPPPFPKWGPEVNIINPYSNPEMMPAEEKAHIQSLKDQCFLLSPLQEARNKYFPRILDGPSETELKEARIMKHLQYLEDRCETEVNILSNIVTIAQDLSLKYLQKMASARAFRIRSLHAAVLLSTGADHREKMIDKKLTQVYEKVMNEAKQTVIDDIMDRFTRQNYPREECEKNTAYCSKIQELEPQGVCFTIILTNNDHEEVGRFTVDKCILAARSPYFGAMSRSNMKEIATGQVKIQTDSIHAVEHILAYIFGGIAVLETRLKKEDFSFDKLVDIVSFADMFGLDSVVELAENRLINEINATNLHLICDYLYSVGTNTSRRYIEEIVAAHYGETITSKDWQNNVSIETTIAISSKIGFDLPCSIKGKFSEDLLKNAEIGLKNSVPCYYSVDYMYEKEPIVDKYIGDGQKSKTMRGKIDQLQNVLSAINWNVPHGGF